ncbi:glycosyltransferase family 4 protein [Flavobacterium sp. KS-LB2]|uniref:glycosyltransferase family 4 protein n=1 Tax=Flavobacterium sp. KS-LB2 TaxID=3120525 RepID=UPI0030CB586E
MNSKKIAVLCNYELLTERVGGMDHFFWMFDATCKENGIQVDWFFPNQSLHGDYSKLTVFSSNHQNVENYFLGFCTQNPSDYSYVITHFIELCTPFFKKIKKISTAKIIAVDHNPRPIHGYPFKKKIEKKIKGFLFSKYINQFIGVSDYTVKELIKDFGFQIKTKTHIIHNGIALEDIQVRQKRNATKPSFLTASHLRESKGIQDLIQAVFILPEEIKKEIVIAVYGDGPYKKELENKIAGLSLQRCFNFMGSHSDLKSIYCEYDYLIHPSYEETFCYAVVESLAANTTVITTKEGGNVLGIITHLDNGFLYEAKKIKELSDLIIQIWIGEFKIEKNTRSDIENHFSLDRMVENHLALLFTNKF